MHKKKTPCSHRLFTERSEFTCHRSDFSRSRGEPAVRSVFQGPEPGPHETPAPGSFRPAAAAHAQWISGLFFNSHLETSCPCMRSARVGTCGARVSEGRAWGALRGEGAPSAHAEAAALPARQRPRVTTGRSVPHAGHCGSPRTRSQLALRAVYLRKKIPKPSS